MCEFIYFFSYKRIVVRFYQTNIYYDFFFQVFPPNPLWVVGFGG